MTLELGHSGAILFYSETSDKEQKKKTLIPLQDIVSVSSKADGIQVEETMNGHIGDLDQLHNKQIEAKLILKRNDHHQE